jgi:gas vesicle protein
MGRKDSAAKTAKRIAIGGAIAGVAGYVAGVLTAPKSGKATRKDLQKIANKRVTEAEKDLKKMHTELGDLLKDSKKSGDKLSKKAQGEFNELVEKAKDTKEKVREVISAIHEGGAEDKDLQKAVKDARAAIDHMRDYLKK